MLRETVLRAVTVVRNPPFLKGKVLVMRVWKSAAVFLICGLTLSGCNAVSDKEVREESGGAQQREQGIPVQQEVLYSDETFGVEIQCSMACQGEYRIVCDEQETFWELDAPPGELEGIRLQPWGEDGTFLILTAVLQDRTENTFILNREMASEVRIQDPLKLAEDCLDRTVVEEEKLILLGEEGSCVECRDEEAMTALQKGLWVMDDITYTTEDGSFVCQVPVGMGPEEIGTFYFYYEYDGVGMNCINIRFISF